MSKIKLQSDASGSGTLTIAAPNTNSDYTFNLPASSGTVATLGSVTTNGVVYVNGSGQPTSGSSLVFDGSNLGLGVTPSASTVPTLQLASQVTLSSGGNSASFAQNAIRDTSWKYITTAAATLYQHAAGAHFWYTAPSGTAGNAITFTQAMTLDASGRLGIGVTSPGQALQVNGRIRISPDGSSGGDLGINSSGLAMSSLGANPIQFWLNNYATEAARIDSSGNLLVGTTSASGKFQVAANTNATAGNRVAIFVSTYSGGDSGYEGIAIVKYANDNSSNQVFQRFFINQGFNANGQIVGAGSGQAAFASYSDARLKENIIDLPPQLDNIMALRPVEFDYKDGSGHQINFIAQEMRDVYPDCVSEDNTPEKMLSIAGWSKTEARLVKAIQEQQAQISDQLAIIDAQQAALDSLKARLDAANL